jgi:hypothetical protein
MEDIAGIVDRTLQNASKEKEYWDSYLVWLHFLANEMNGVQQMQTKKASF